MSIAEIFRTPSSRRFWGAVFMGISVIQMLALGGIFGWCVAVKNIDFSTSLPWLFPVILLIVPGMLLYWSGLGGLDELARDAHRRAWFWGGSFGLAFGLFLSPLAPWALQMMGFLSLVPAVFGVQVTAFAGATIAALCAFLGYCVWWAGFWLVKR